MIEIMHPSEYDGKTDRGERLMGLMVEAEAEQRL